MPDRKLGLVAKLSSYALVIVLLLAFTGVATYAVLSDNSIHGLTIRFYNVSWSCGSPGLTYTVGSVVVSSTNALVVSMSHVSFSLSTNGISIGNVTEHDSSFGQGQSTSYSLSLTNPGLDTSSQPATSLIAVTMNAHVSSGLYSSQASATNSETVRFPSLSC